MSVIFQTLKRLKQQEAGSQSQVAKKARGRKSGLLQRVLRTPLSMVIILLIIFLSGFLLLHGMDRLTLSQRASRRVPVVEKQSLQNSNSVENQLPRDDPVPTSEKIESNALPSENLRQEYEVALTGESTSVVYQPSGETARSFSSADDRSIENPEEMKARYQGYIHTPAKVITSAEDAKASQFKSQTGSYGSENEKATGSPDTMNAIAGSFSPSFPLTESSPLASKPEGSMAGSTEITPVLSLGPTIRNDNDKDSLSAGRDNKPENDREKPKVKAAPVITQLLDSEDQQRLVNLENFRREAKKRAAVIQLVNRIERAIDRMDAPEVEKMLPRLATAKGEDNLYVMNLKAFWYLKQEYFSEAESLLLKILKLEPDHLEAGLNLAVVEAQTQRSESALKRIERLQELYPDNPVLNEMIRKLR